jgi:hypothetical protein
MRRVGTLPRLPYSLSMTEHRSRHDEDEARRREAEKILEDLKRRGPSFAGSSLSDAARRAVDHFGGKDALGAAEGGTTDPIELWGRRIGRTLSLIVFIGLGIYLFVTYALR